MARPEQSSFRRMKKRFAGHSSNLASKDGQSHGQSRECPRKNRAILD
jgi:hypothetical protein